MNRCFYCGGRLTGDERPEHVIPLAIGAVLETLQVCDPCNTKAGREVEKPWLRDPHVHPLRVKHKIPNRRKNPVSPRQIIAKLDDGRTARVIDHGSHQEIQPLPRTTVDEVAGRLRVEASPKDFATIAARLKKERPDLRWVFTRPGSGTVTATATEEVSIETWPRFASKVTLALMSLLVDDSWLETDTAKELQTVLWSGARQANAMDGLGWAWAAIPAVVNRATAPGNLLGGPEHLLCFEADQRGAALCIIVFGDLLYRVRLSGLKLPLDAPAWLLDPKARTVVCLPWPLLHAGLELRRLQKTVR
jgi:hypothetical protein